VPGFLNYQKGCTRLTVASDKVYKLLAHGRWFSPGILASSTTKTGHHDIAEILMKVALNTINQIKSNLARKPLNQGYLVVKLKSSRHQVESITVATMTCLAITEYLCHK